MARTKSVPCEDCEREKKTLTILGFEVLGCVPDPGMPGFCTISFREVTAPPVARADLPGLQGNANVMAAFSPATTEGAPLLTQSQMQSAQAIVNLFETGSVLGNYGGVTLIPGDPGHLTYGRSQTTLASGNLGKLMKAYCANPGARFGSRLQSHLQRFLNQDLSLDHDLVVQNLLRACADDPVMRETQDAFFQSAYWEPALRAARRLGIVSALGTSVVYDSHVHGSWLTVRDLVTADVGEVSAVGERAWITAYVERREAWLANNKIAAVRPTVYRMQAFKRLIDQHLWGLELPLVVRKSEISLRTLQGDPPGTYGGPAPGSRLLALTSPLSEGLDVRLLQLGLSVRGMHVIADGIYGPASVNSVRSFQAAIGVPATGVADPALIAMLVN